MANEKNIRIGDVLLQAGYINQDELDEALEYQKNNKGIRLGEALIRLYHRAPAVRSTFSASWTALCKD